MDANTSSTQIHLVGRTEGPVEHAEPKTAWEKPALKSLSIFDAQLGFGNPNSDATGFS